MKEGYKVLRGEDISQTKVADLHIHTNYSDGLLFPQQIVDLAAALGLDSIAITDHDKFFPAEIAWNYAQQKNYPLEVVLGTELNTQEGHLLAFFIKEEIRRMQSTTDAIAAIHAQGGIAIAPHPGYKMVGSLSLSFQTCFELLQHPDPKYRLDGLEIFNAGVSFRAMRNIEKGKLPQLTNEVAQLFYNDSPIGTAIGTTDTHFNAVGVGLTGYNENLKTALQAGKTAVLEAEIEHILGHIIPTSEQLLGKPVVTRISRI